MFRLAALALLSIFATSASAQEHVTVAAQRLTENGALFIADARSYFKAEGLDVEMIAYPSEREVARPRPRAPPTSASPRSARRRSTTPAKA
jgi:NitT/TauT family transport system substrate-binding protein